MGFLSGSSKAGTVVSPWDDRWYMPMLGMTSDAGITISPDTALLCGTVLAALRFKAQSFGICPPKVYIEREKNGRSIREEDRQHYLFKLLRRPNLWQTGFQWRTLMGLHSSMWGNAYNRIVESDRVFVGQLRPLHPSCTRVIDQAGDGRLIYEYRSPRIGVAPERLSQDQVLHFRDLSLDGFTGLVTYQLIRNIVGIALSAERHASMFMKQGARIAGIVSPKGSIAEAAQKRAERGLKRAWGGPDSEGKVVLLGQEFDYKPVSHNHRESQFIELRDHQVEEVLRALGVPGVVVGYSKNLMGYASADAFFEKGGIKHCLLPMVENFQDEIDYALIRETDPHYCKFSLDTLVRASTKDTYDMLYKASGGPIMSTNEARRIVDLNPDDSPACDEILRPKNMGTAEENAAEDDPPPPAPAAPPARPTPTSPSDEEDEQAARLARLQQFAVDAAAGVIRREIAAVKGNGRTIGAGQRYKGNASAWAQWVEKFYDEHAAVVSRELKVSAEAARVYTGHQAGELLRVGPEAAHEAVGAWEASRYPVLEAMALGEPWEPLLKENASC